MPGTLCRIPSVCLFNICEWMTCCTTLWPGQACGAIEDLVLFFIVSSYTATAFDMVEFNFSFCCGGVVAEGILL